MKAAKINITCDICHTTYEVNRDKTAHKTAISMRCNWCPDCEEKAEDYYDEWYNYNDNDNNVGDDPMQLMLFSIADEVLNQEVKTSILEI